MHDVTAHCRRSPVFMGLLRHSRQLGRFERELKGDLPDPLRDHVKVANLRPGLLVLHVDNSAWASRLRFMQSALLDFCARQAPENMTVNKIQVRVRPPLMPRPILRSRRASLSADSAGLLRDLAGCLNDDKLGHALLRLANHSRQ